MIPYRFKRRSFLAGLGGAFGLELMLRNLEASAAGTPSPPRFLVTHWPMGTLRAEFVPAGTGTDYVASPLLEPFEAAGLRNEMIALFGLSHAGIRTNGGGPEGGTVMAVTGANTAGIRSNGGENDDPCAGGPSWDQIFLKNVPALGRRDSSGAIIGPGYANAICDSRVESFETSTRCLSYDYAKQEVSGAGADAGTTINENVPLRPELSPARLYARLFSGFMPGGSVETTLRALKMRKSVLDSALRELARMNGLAPASERVKIDAHADAIRKLERELQQRIDQADPAGCTPPEAPPETLVGKSSDRESHITNPLATEGDDATHEAVGRAHMSVIRTAFQCDVMRVATFQWAPGTGSVALTGIRPGEPVTAYHYRGITFRNGAAAFWSGPRPTDLERDGAWIWEAMRNVYLWYNRRMAELVASFDTATDVFGNTLLSHTVIPYFTDISHPANVRTELPALIFGGSALGLRGGQFQSFSRRFANDYWLTLGQAFLGASVLEALSSEVFVKTDLAPIAGLWVAP
jgi:hypothetical protein